MRMWTLGALIAPGSALAHGAETRLEIDNHFEGEAEVWVDGRYLGTVAGSAAATFETKPGKADVSVRRPGTGYVLASTRLHLHPHTTVSLPIDAPPGTLRVRNTGEIALRLDLENRDLWVAPRTTVEVGVQAGHTELRALVHEPRGEWLAVERAVWVEPGRPAEVDLRADPTALTVSNREGVPLRILLDGVEVGWMGPAQDRRVWVRPGPTAVVLLDAFGRVREHETVFVPRGEEVHVSAGPERPGGPIRLARLP